MDAVKINTGKVTFETEGGIKFAVPVLTFATELRELADTWRAEYERAEEAKDAEGMRAHGHNAYLLEVARIIKDRHAAELSLDEVEWFVNELEIQHAKKKQRQVESLKDTLNSVYSLGSPASPPAESPTTN